MSMTGRPLRILMIEPLDDGGIAHYAFNLANALAKRGAHIILFTSKDYELRNEDSGFEVYPYMFKFASYVIKLFPWLKKETIFPSALRRSIKLFEYPLNVLDSLLIAKKKKVEIVHFQTVNLTELLMILVFRLAGIKIVFTIHNVKPRHQELKFYHSFGYRLMYSLCDRIIIHSQSGRDEVVQLFVVDPHKVTVIPHGDYKFFLPENNMSDEQAKMELGIPINCKTILFFGAIRSNKGLDNLLLAMQQIKKKVPEVKLMIIGEPCENYKKYSDIIKREHIQENVFERLEYIPNQMVGKYFFASDVVVLPYNEITQSGVLQIAYAFGKPVVATAIGGFKESIEDGKNGFLVSSKDIPGLAEKVTEILSNNVIKESMGKYSRHLSDTKYSWDAIATKTVGLYLQLGV